MLLTWLGSASATLGPLYASAHPCTALESICATLCSACVLLACPCCCCCCCSSSPAAATATSAAPLPHCISPHATQQLVASESEHKRLPAAQQRCSLTAAPAMHAVGHASGQPAALLKTSLLSCCTAACRCRCQCVLLHKQRLLPLLLHVASLSEPQS